MFTWLSIRCSQLEGLLTSKGNRPFGTFEALLHQQEAEEAATNERAKIVHSRKDLKAKVKCAKAVMKAKYDYRGGHSGSQGDKVQ